MIDSGNRSKVAVVSTGSTDGVCSIAADEDAPPQGAETHAGGFPIVMKVAEAANVRVFASGATELWASDVRQGDRLGALGDAALEAERPLHVALEASDRTLCGEPVHHMREYAVEFGAQEGWLRCPVCDRELGHPVSG